MHALFVTPPFGKYKTSKEYFTVSEEDSKGEVRVMTFAFLSSTLFVLQDGRQVCTKFHDDESLYTERKTITCKVRNWQDLVSLYDVMYTFVCDF